MFLRLEGFEQFDKFERLDVQMRKAGYTAGGKVKLVDGDNGRAIQARLSGVGLVVPWTTDKITIGFSGKFSSRGCLFSVSGMPFIFDLLTGSPRFAGCIGGALPLRNKWYYYETVVDRSDKSVELFINGKSQGKGVIPDGTDMQNVRLILNDYSQQRTLENYNDYWSEEEIKKYQESQNKLPSEERGDASIRTFDNLYVKEGDPIGPVSITTRRPTDTVVNEWFIESTGDEYTDAAQLLGANPPDELEHYLRINKDGKSIQVTSSDKMPDIDGRIVALGMVALVRKTNREDASVILGIDSNAQEVTDLPFSWGYRYVGWDAPEGYTKEQAEKATMKIVSGIRSV